MYPPAICRARLNKRGAFAATVRRQLKNKLANKKIYSLPLESFSYLPIFLSNQLFIFLVPGFQGTYWWKLELLASYFGTEMPSKPRSLRGTFRILTEHLKLKNSVLWASVLILFFKQKEAHKTLFLSFKSSVSILKVPRRDLGLLGPSRFFFDVTQGCHVTFIFFW